MNQPCLLSPVRLEDLSQPISLEQAIYFRILPQGSVCNGKCCTRGSYIPCKTVFPHKRGIIVQKGDHLYLNNTVPLIYTTPIKEIEVERTEHGTVVLGYNLGTRVIRALEHPWGALIIEEEIKTSFPGLVVSILAIPH